MRVERKIAVIGLGYVGLTLAVAFGKITSVIAYDCDTSRIAELKNGQDRNLEVDNNSLLSSELQLTSEPGELKNSDFYIIATP